jgi:ribose-phosphate pyrophosphokinase
MATPLIIAFHESLLAPVLAKNLNIPLQKLYPQLFADGEFSLPEVQVGQTDHIIFVVDFVAAGTELIHIELLAVALLLRQLAKHIAKLSLVMPYLPYERAEQFDASPMALVIEQLQKFNEGYLLTLDIHNEQVGQPMLIAHKTDSLWYQLTRSLDLGEELVVVSPDKGGCARAQRLAELLHVPVGIMSKQRDAAGLVSVAALTENVAGKTVLLRDDIVDTARTAVEAVTLLRQKGATRIFGFFTHPILSDGAEARLAVAGFDGIFFTNSLIKMPLSCAKIIHVDDLLSNILRQHLQ